MPRHHIEWYGAIPPRLFEPLEKYMVDTEKPAPFARKRFVDANGEKISEPGADVAAITFEFAEFDDVMVSLGDFSEAIRVALAWHGLSQKLGDSYANASKKPAEECYDSFQSTLERLQASDWVKAREAAGPRTSLVFEAVLAVMAAAGKPADDTTQTAIRAALTEKPERDRAMADARVKLQYEKIRLARAQERLAKIEAEAAAASDEALPF